MDTVAIVCCCCCYVVVVVGTPKCSVPRRIDVDLLPARSVASVSDLGCASEPVGACKSTGAFCWKAMGLLKAT